jgi:hypothetical protein
LWTDSTFKIYFGKLKNLCSFAATLVIFVKRSLTQIGPLLLLLIFSIVQLLPVLHHHPEIRKTSLTTVSGNTSGKHTIDTPAPDCLICDFIAHKQADYPSTFTALTFTVFAVKPITLNTDHSQQLFETAVHTWTNKGPPTI